MTRVSIIDGTEVTLNGATSSVAVNGPGTFDCSSVTVSGSTLTGTILVNTSGVYQLLQWHPYYHGLFPYAMVFAFFAALAVSKFRL